MVVSSPGREQSPIRAGVHPLGGSGSKIPGGLLTALEPAEVRTESRGAAPVSPGALWGQAQGLWPTGLGASAHLAFSQVSAVFS